MRVTPLIIFASLALAATAALAATPANHLPPKATPVVPDNVPLPDRQGGEDIFHATLIPALPFSDTGTTTGHYDDYDEICPYSGSTSPDVVYYLNAGYETYLTVDLCGSAYDTKTYVYDTNFNLLACNDDFYYDATCGIYTSYLEVPISGPVYIVVDGYYGAYGNYVLNVTGWGCDCPVICPAGGVPEGEPPLVDDYVDDWNGGCNTEPGRPFQEVLADPATGTAILCGVSGWYHHHGASYRDTDWFLVPAGFTGEVTATAQAEIDCYLFELWPQDCAGVGVAELVEVDACGSEELSMTGYQYPGYIWLWIGPTVFTTPPGWDNEFDWVIWLEGLPTGVATESAAWSEVKALFD
jgi:hypothetical protein